MEDFQHLLPENLEYTSEEVHSCPNCGDDTRPWKLPVDVSQPPSGHADAPGDGCCPQCWTEWACETWKAVDEEQVEA